MVRLFSLFVAAMLGLVGCRQERGDTPAPTVVVQTARAEAPAPATTPAQAAATTKFRHLLREPVHPELVEEPVQALPLWQAQPGSTLVLFADRPFLAALPATGRADVARVLRAGGEELRRRSERVADPLLLPDMAVRAALAAGFFRELIWVVPVRGPGGRIDLAGFRALMRETGTLDEIAIASFDGDGHGGLTGNIAGVAIRVVPSGSLPSLATPVAVHFDLGFFNELYPGEVKSPLFSLVGSMMKSVQEKGWPVTAVTISRGNHTGRLPLGTRFLGDVLATLIAEPDRLDAPLPKAWDLRQRILYLENFFQSEEIGRLFREMNRLAPQDAAAVYGLYQLHWRNGEKDEGARWLRRAVELDQGYALEFLALAAEERAQQRPQAAISWLQAAVAAVPADPFYRLSLCEDLFELRRMAELKRCAEPLHALPWSPQIYPEIPAVLDTWQGVKAQ